MLHIGSHKTASTYFQKTCSANAEQLARAGCVFLGPERLRRDLIIPSLDRPMKDILRKTRPLRAVIAQATEQGQRLLLSNENTIGGPRPPVIACADQLYPKAQDKITALLEALDVEQVTIALALRNPLDLMVSAWGHQYLAGRPIAFEAFMEDVQPEALCWRELVARLQDCPRVGRLVLWRFEAYHGRINDLVATLARLPGPTALQPPPDAAGWTYLVGPSARAIEALPHVMRRHPELTAKDALRRAMRRFPKSAEFHGPDPFTSDQRACARDRYDAEWRLLAATPGLCCLDPDQP